MFYFETKQMKRPKNEKIEKLDNLDLFWHAPQKSRLNEPNGQLKSECLISGIWCLLGVICIV